MSDNENVSTKNAYKIICPDVSIVDKKKTESSFVV